MPQFTHFLQFWTSSAELIVDYEGPESEERYGNHRLTIRGFENAAVGIIYLDGEWRMSKPNALEFIVLSRDITKRDPKWDPDWKGRLNLLLIERDGEIAYRVERPLDPIVEEEWIKVERQWKLITLG
jgi:hypothetical protein